MASGAVRFVKVILSRYIWYNAIRRFKSLKHVATIPLNMFADQLVASGWETLKRSECIHHLGKAKVKKKTRDMLWMAAKSCTPSGNLLHSELERSTMLSMGKSTISTGPCSIANC